MIGRRPILLVIAAGVLAPTSIQVRAQQSGRMFRVGILGYTTAAQAFHFYVPFMDELRRLGYVEGRNIAFEFVWAESRPERLPALAAELVKRGVNLIYATAATAVAAAKGATSSVPIVAIAGDMVEQGFVKTFARPGGNITGIDTSGTGIIEKQLEILKRIVPTISKVAMLHVRGSPVEPRFAAAGGRAARKLGTSFESFWMENASDLERVFEEMARAKIEVALLSANPILLVHYSRAADLALRHRIATACYLTSGAEAGVLLAYDSSVPNLTRRAAAIADKILKGADPAEIPVEFATEFKLTINLKTATALGITVPSTVLALADRVIE